MIWVEKAKKILILSLRNEIHKVQCISQDVTDSINKFGIDFSSEYGDIVFVSHAYHDKNVFITFLNFEVTYVVNIKFSQNGEVESFKYFEEVR